MKSTRAIAYLLITILISLELVKSASTGQKTENRTENATSTGPINVLILTYSRSGSSFAGELFSSYPSSAYIFEPLYYAAIKQSNRTSEAYREVISKLMTCDTEMLDKVRDDPVMVMIRKFADANGPFLEPEYNSTQTKELCQKSPHKVIKTIRLKLKDALQLITSGSVPNLKIVHLVRDPRARYNSMLDKDGSWRDIDRRYDSVCARMEKDLQLAKSMPPSQYKLIKYEDLVADPKVMAEDVFAFLFGVHTLPEEAISYLDDHYAKANLEKNEYYSTIRDTKFAPNHWEHDLNRTTIEAVQKHPSCKFILDKMNYPLKVFQ